MFETDDFPEFVPHPLLRGGHLQTLGLMILRKPVDPQSGTCHIVELSDGDQLAVIDDEFDGWMEGGRVVIALHGLTGCHQSQYMVRFRNQLESLPLRLFRIDMRGYGDSTFISKGHCNAGSYQDVADVIQWVRKLCPKSPITLVGYSLGGGIILHYLGRDPQSVPDEIDSCLTIAPPIDLIYSSWNLRSGLNRIYDHSFINALHRQLFLRRRRVSGIHDNDLVPLPTRLLQFDDQFTSIVCGFNGAKDYYEKCSAAPVLKDVRVPTRILLARDDPVIPIDMFQSWPMSDAIRLYSTRTGGHLGYIGRSLNCESRWLDQRLAAWLKELIHGQSCLTADDNGAGSGEVESST